MPAEVLEYVEAVVTCSGRGGQAEQHTRPHMVEQSLVTRRGGVVELIDDNVFIVIAAQIVERPALIALDRHEQVIELARLATTDQEIAKVRVPENSAEGLEALLSNSSRWATKRSRGLRACRRKLLTSPVAIVERGDHRLPGSRGGNDQVAVATLNLALGIEPVEDLLLERPGPELEREWLGAGRFDRPLFLQCPLQPRPLGLRDTARTPGLPSRSRMWRRRGPKGGATRIGLA